MVFGGEVNISKTLTGNQNSTVNNKSLYRSIIIFDKPGFCNVILLMLFCISSG